MRKQEGGSAGSGSQGAGTSTFMSGHGRMALLGGSELAALHGHAASDGDLAHAFERSVADLTCPGAGPDIYLRDGRLHERLGSASCALVQVMGAANLGNAFYRVHPRRNDRVVEVLPMLMRLYPEVDFTEIHFTRHLTASLRAVCPTRFDVVAQELQRQWLNSMRLLLGLLPPQVLLLWLGDAEPPSHAVDRPGMPCLIDAGMLGHLQDMGAGLLCHVTPRVISPPLMAPAEDAHDLALAVVRGFAGLAGNGNGPHLAAGPGQASGS